MKVSSSFKHLEHTPALDERINSKSQKLKKYFDGNFDVSWTCFIKDDGQQCAEIKVVGPSFEYHASSATDSLYKSFDQVVNKIERQIQKKKSKWKNHLNGKNQHNPKNMSIAEAERDEIKYQKDLEDEAS